MMMTPEEEQELRNAVLSDLLDFVRTLSACNHARTGHVPIQRDGVRGIDVCKECGAMRVLDGIEGPWSVPAMVAHAAKLHELFTIADSDIARVVGS